MKDQATTVDSSQAGTHDASAVIQTENNTKKSILSRILQATWNWIKANKWGLLAAFIATALVAGLVFGGIVYYPMVLFMLEAVPYIGIGVAKLAFAATTIPQAAAIVGAIAGGLTAAAITSIWLFVGTCKMVFNKLLGAGSPPGGNGAGSAAVNTDSTLNTQSVTLSPRRAPQMTQLHSHMEGWSNLRSDNTTNPKTTYQQPHDHNLHASHAAPETLLSQLDSSANDGLYSMSPGSVEPESAEVTAQRDSPFVASVGSNPYATFSPVSEPDAQLETMPINNSQERSASPF